ARQALDGTGQEPLEALRQEGAPEKLNGVSILGGALVQIHLPEIRGELGLLVAAARDVLMWAHHLPPRPELTRNLALDWRSGGPTLRRSHLLLEPDAKQLGLELLEVVRLRRRNRGEESRGGVERPVGVIRAERILVRPAVTNLAQLGHERPARLAKD